MIFRIIANHLPKLIGLIVPTVGELVKAETPKIGQKLAENGAKLLTGGTAVAATAATIQLPEVPDNWVALLQQAGVFIGSITSLIGAICVLVGKSQTTGNPDTDL